MHKCRSGDDIWCHAVVSVLLSQGCCLIAPRARLAPAGPSNAASAPGVTRVCVAMPDFLYTGAGGSNSGPYACIQQGLLPTEPSPQTLHNTSWWHSLSTPSVVPFCWSPSHSHGFLYLSQGWRKHAHKNMLPRVGVGEGERSSVKLKGCFHDGSHRNILIDISTDAYTHSFRVCLCQGKGACRSEVTRPQELRGRRRHSNILHLKSLSVSVIKCFRNEQHRF